MRPTDKPSQAMCRATRIVGAVMVLVGVCMALRFGLGWRAFLESGPPSLCGCEFDAAVRHRHILSFLVACGTAVFAAIAGVSLMFRYRRGLIVLAAWFLAAASLPWIDQVIPLPYAVESSAPIDDPSSLIWTLAAVVLGLFCLRCYQVDAGAKRRPITVGDTKLG